MLEFRIIKKSAHSRARVGVLKTPHGEVETPSLVPVATLANVKTLTSEEVRETKTQILIANTYHLHLKPGEKIVKAGGGLHRFMNWQAPLMTDSGGFQVFSLGFGQDLGVGKMLKYFPGKHAQMVREGAQPKSVKITSDGVRFRSPIDGRELFLGPKESVRIQEELGADIIFAFDECTPPNANYAYTEESLRKTHRWANICLDAKKSKQAIFGIVQGGHFKALRVESTRVIGALDFDGFGIGGELGNDKKAMLKILDWALPVLPPDRPRHMLGIGHPEDIPLIVKAGIDTFDCIAPTHYARHGVAFVARGRPAEGEARQGRLDMKKSLFLKDKKPLDATCACRICDSYSRSYISHLVRAKEITGLHLLTLHNLFYFNTLVEQIREGIKRGRI